MLAAPDCVDRECLGLVVLGRVYTGPGGAVGDDIRTRHSHRLLYGYSIDDV
jgi:hypothetical protein